MDTIKIHHPGVRMIAHRGVSGLECENTAAAFVAAGNRSYFGIETDVHQTSDGRLIIIHDDSTGRVSEEALSVEGSTFDALRAIHLKDHHGLASRGDLVLPTLEEYLSICRKYEKTAVLELKNAMSEAAVRQVLGVLNDMRCAEQTVIISFDWNNLLHARRHAPDQRIQFLTGDAGDAEALAKRLAEHRFGLDIGHWAYTPEAADAMHKHRVEVNGWTVDSPADAERVMALGVDYITSNILV